MSDPSHILYEEYSFLPSNRRLRVAYARLNWLLLKLFVYQSVKLINQNWGSNRALENRKDSLFKCNVAVCLCILLFFVLKCVYCIVCLVIIDVN